LFVTSIYVDKKIPWQKKKVLVLENVGGVDENTHSLNRNPTTSLLDVENVHLQSDNDFIKNDMCIF
jgi:hypothetical protein